MATTKIWDVRGWLGQVVNYIENPEKTENTGFSEADIQGLRDVMNYATQDYKTEKQFYVSGINCLPETARQQMLLTKKRWVKEGGIVAFHGYQSFAPGEVTPELAHEIGLKLAKELWGDRFEVIVATHLDKAHLHSHFVLNSVSFLDGKRYNDCKATYKGSLKHRMSSVKGLRALYLHYVYLLSRVQRQPIKKASFRLREDIRKLDEITAQTKLLCRHQIDTKEQLEAFIKHSEAERAHLVSERKAVNNRKRRTTDEVSLEKYQTQSKEVTRQLAVIRSELKAANEVLFRSIEIKNEPADSERQKEDCSMKPELVINIHQHR